MTCDGLPLAGLGRLACGSAGPVGGGPSSLYRRGCNMRYTVKDGPLAVGYGQSSRVRSIASGASVRGVCLGELASSAGRRALRLSHGGRMHGGAFADLSAGDVLLPVRDGASFRLCAYAVSLFLILNLLFAPRVAYADIIGPVSVVLEAGSAAAEAIGATVVGGLTGITGLAAGVGGVGAALGAYSWWAMQNPEQDEYLRGRWVQQLNSQVGTDQYSIDLTSIDHATQTSLIQGVGDYYKANAYKPVIVSNGFPGTIFTGDLVPDTINGEDVHWPSETGTSNYRKSKILQQATPYGYVRYTHVSSGGGYYSPNGVSFFSGPGTLNVYYENNSWHIRYQLEGSTTISTTTIAASGAIAVFGMDMGDGLDTSGVSMASDIPAGLSGAFSSFVDGAMSAGDVALAATRAAEGVRLPDMVIDTSTGQVTVPATVPVAGESYYSYAIAGSGAGSGGGDVSADMTEVLSAIASLAGVVNASISPIGSIPLALSALGDDVLGLDLRLTGIGNDVLGLQSDMAGLGSIGADLLGTLDDIAGLLGSDVIGAIDDLGVSLGADVLGLGTTLDGVAGTLTGIGGVISGIGTAIPGIGTAVGTTIPGLLSDVLDDVAALPDSIAASLDLDWVLDNLDSLRDRIPSVDPPLVLPQASFSELQEVMEQYKSRTPLGKFFTAYETVFDVLSEEPGSSAPRYEFAIPAPVNTTFVVDFATFDGRFVAIVRAFTYLGFIFWYMRVLKAIRRWYGFWLGLDSPGADAATKAA